MSESFIGMNDFVWFVGVVENRKDPLKAGRLQVRVLGHHTPDKSKISTADLMWASPMWSCNDAGISGLGNSPGFTPEGTHVMGYFRDGTDRQEPVILGVLPGIPTEKADTTLGFYDPNGKLPRYTNEPDVNRLAVNDKDSGGNETNPHLSLELRRAVRLTGIVVAGYAGNTLISDADGSAIIPNDTYDEPEISYNADYPFNHVYESESGHIREYDDTEGAERIHERHRTGTSYEIDPEGTRIDKVVKNQFTTIDGTCQELIIQDKTETIGGHYKLLVNRDGQADKHLTIELVRGNINIQCDAGDLNIFTNGNVNMNTLGNFNHTILGNYNLNIGGNRSVQVGANTTDNTLGSVIHTGATINLNP